MLTTNDIHAYLNSLNDELGQLGVKGELCLFGAIHINELNQSHAIL